MKIKLGLLITFCISLNLQTQIYTILSDVKMETLNQTSSIEIILDINNVNCKGENSGSVSAIIENGTPPFQYLWSTSDTIDLLDSLAAGNYSVTISDNSGNLDSVDFEITEPSEPLSVGLGVQYPNCNGFGGWVISNVSGGTPPYSYSWDSGATGPADATFGFGNYALTVTDANNCTFANSTNITLTCSLEATAYASDVSCIGGADGAISLGYTGCATGTVEYCISGGSCSTNSYFDNLAAGTYDFLVFSNVCTDFISITIEEPDVDSLSFELVDITNIDCSTPYGQIQVTGTGGIPPYSYLWDNGEQTNLIDSLSIKFHSFTIIDSIGCSVHDSIEITSFPFISTGNDTSLFFPCPEISESMEITPIFEDTFNNYIFEWENINGNILSSGSFAPLITDTAGTYIFTAIDTLNNCSFSKSIMIYDTLNIAVFPILSAGENATLDHTCPNNKKVIEVTPIFDGVLSNYIFDWKHENGSVLSSGSFTPLMTDSAGMYIFTAFDTVYNCLFSDSVNVYNQANFNSNTIVSSPIINHSIDGFNNGSINPNISGGVPPYTYQWITGSSNVELTGLHPAFYSLIVNDSNNCYQSFSYQVESTTNISHLELRKINLYPNPGKGIFQIKFDNSNLEFHQVKVYDSLGKYILQTTLNQANQTVNLTRMENGIYFIAMESKNGLKFLEKIVIIH